MSIDYRKAFEKLVEQIETEDNWAREQYKNDCEYGQREKVDVYGVERYDKGMLFAYGSIRELAEQLKNGTFEFDEEIEGESE